MKNSDPEGFAVYERDPQTLARKWVLPGTPNFEHRIGGLEKMPIKAMSVTIRKTTKLW